MKINVADVNTIIEVNKLQEVTSPRLMSTKMTFDANGLLSNEIFGISRTDRQSTFGFINLKKKFIHPHLYQKVLKSIFKNIVYLVAGQRYYSVKDGLLVEDPDNGWTGLEELYKHWNQLDWTKSKSENKTNKAVLINLSRDQLFIDKILVIPPYYRDVTIAGAVDSSDHVNELNSLYSRLISHVALIQQGGLFSRVQYNTQLKIQETLVEIYDYFKGAISKKHGLIRKNLLGKTVDYGTRSVITAATYNHDRFEDNAVGIEYSAVPISHCCSLFYPFIESWIRNFFTRDIINDPNLITFTDRETNQSATAKIHDPEIQFSDRVIKKMINDYILNPDNRFKKLEIVVDVPTSPPTTAKFHMSLKGKIILKNNAQEELKRPMTITDLLYLACVDVAEKRHVMTSRYPVGTDKGIFFSRVNVQSTLNHVHLVFNGKDYPRYPVIDFKIPEDQVGIQFIDSLVMSNSHCDGMGEP